MSLVSPYFHVYIGFVTAFFINIFLYELEVVIQRNL